MKSISSLIKWILFIPVCMLSVIVALFEGINPGSVSNFFATNSNGLAGIIAFSVLGLFVACFVISLFDRKTSPVHILRKNPVCGVLAVAVALSMAASAALDLTSLVNAAESISIMSVITILFTAIGGVTMLYLGLNHFSGKNTPKEISLLYLSLPLWCGAHLIDRFLKNTATPVAAAESMDLIMFVAMAMFFMNVIMIHAVVSVKNSVKAVINYGLATVVVALVYSINQSFAAINKEAFNALDHVPFITYGLIALYAMSFVAELSFRSKTVDEQIIVSNDSDKEESADDSQEESEQAADNDSAESKASDTPDDDYGDNFDSYGDAEEPEEEPEVKEQQTDKPSEEVIPVQSAVSVRQTDEDKPEAENTDDTAESESPLSADESSDEVDAAELFKAAQQRDNKSAKDENKKSGSDEMILDGNSERVEPVYSATKSADKPKGPTTREAIMYEDEDFILTIENNDFTKESKVEDEDVSAFILDSPMVEDATVAKKSYDERLDEIDKLIISIQGGDSPNNE